MALRGREPVLEALNVLADVPHELSAQIGDGGEDATGDDVALDPGEPQFDLVEPGRVSRREVQPDTIKWRSRDPTRRITLNSAVTVH